MVPSGSIARKALISFGTLAEPHACGPMLAASARPGNATLMARPPAAEADETTKWRRVMAGYAIWVMARLPLTSSSTWLRGGLQCGFWRKVPRDRGLSGL